MHQKPGNFVWNILEDDVIEENEEYKPIWLRELYYKFIKDEEGGCARKEIYWYPYLKHIIEFWPGDWEEHLLKMNEVVRYHNQHQNNLVKRQLVVYGSLEKLVPGINDRSQYYKISLWFPSTCYIEYSIQTTCIK